MNNTCLTCKYNRGLIKSPGGQIKKYKYWFLEHINEPVPVLGWLVLKTKRHTEGIVGMNCDEAKELGEILNVLPKIQKEICNAKNVYVVCFSELVSHLHFHLIPRHINEHRKGFNLLSLVDIVKKNKTKAVDVKEAIKFSKILRQRL